MIDSTPDTVLNTLPEEDTPYSNLCQRYSARVPTQKVPTEAILTGFKVTNRKPVLGINVGTDWAGARQPEKGGVPGGDEKFDRLQRNDVFSCLPTGYEKTEIVKQCRASENGGYDCDSCATMLTPEVPETLENRNRFDSRAGGRAFLGQTSSLGHERRADVHHWVATDRPIATISVGYRTGVSTSADNLRENSDFPVTLAELLERSLNGRDGGRISTTLVTAPKMWSRDGGRISTTLVTAPTPLYQRQTKVHCRHGSLATAPAKIVQRLIAARATLAKQRWSSVQDFCVGLADQSVRELAFSDAKL
ncbi:hypothetical protein Bbelb_374270 [Branchiostoma belcheri]|nr:hypothetical protein Bbelb_374270 [Branchiostoma belcheri]